MYETVNFNSVGLTGVAQLLSYIRKKLYQQHNPGSIFYRGPYSITHIIGLCEHVCVTIKILSIPLLIIFREINELSLDTFTMSLIDHVVFLQDSEVHITYEDQQQINTFARHNARLQDIKEELAAKQVLADEVSLLFFTGTSPNCKCKTFFHNVQRDTFNKNCNMHRMHAVIFSC